MEIDATHTLTFSHEEWLRFQGLFTEVSRLPEMSRETVTDVCSECKDFFWDKLSQIKP